MVDCNLVDLQLEIRVSDADANSIRFVQRRPLYRIVRHCFSSALLYFNGTDKTAC